MYPFSGSYVKNRKLQFRIDIIFNLRAHSSIPRFLSSDLMNCYNHDCFKE